MEQNLVLEKPNNNNKIFDNIPQEKLLIYLYLI